MRDFDPRKVGILECETWVRYYRREWWPFLRAALAVTRHTFGLSWPRTAYGAWLVMRANQQWAPYPDNDPQAARRTMRRFYGLVARTHGEHLDLDEVSRLEIDWWRIHRELQRERPDDDNQPLVDALAALYAQVYRVPPARVALAAAERAQAMRWSDQWVADGCNLASPLITQERAALVRSYAALLAAVHTA
jgi:hypothetical protein